MKKYFIAVIVLFLSVSQAFAKHQHNEKYYQNIWCSKNGGIMEYTLNDKTRVDCLTSTHAVEVDFAKKWAEAIGQSLYYSAITGKQAGIVLIVENDKDLIYPSRIKNLCKKYNISLWVQN